MAPFPERENHSMPTIFRQALQTGILCLALPTWAQDSAAGGIPPSSGNPSRADFLLSQDARIAIGALYETPGSGDPYLVGLHLAQLNNRKPDQLGWGFSARFSITPGMLERDTTNRPSEIAPSDATPTGRHRIRALEVSGGVNLCLAAPLWVELGGGYYLPERTASYTSKNGYPRWYADGENSAVPMAMAALVADLSTYRIPVYFRVGIARADNTNLYSAGLGWAATLPK